MNTSTQTSSLSCKSTLREEFSLERITAYGGASLVADLLAELKLSELLTEHLDPKAPWPKYTRDVELTCLLLGDILGIKRVSHMKELECDPLLERVHREVLGLFLSQSKKPFWALT